MSNKILDDMRDVMRRRHYWIRTEGANIEQAVDGIRSALLPGAKRQRSANPPEA